MVENDVSNLILVVDDDDHVLDTVGFLLRDTGYRVSEATNKDEMLTEMTASDPDLILLDVNLGDENGFEIALEVRKTSNIPIIMLTGKGSETDRVVGLELGADDYITKPYSTAELLARVKAVLRRSKITKGSTNSEKEDIAKFDDWECDIDRRILISPQGKTVKLSSGEFSLLVAFLRSGGRSMSREHLLDITGREDNFDRSVDIQIMRLRRKLSNGNESDKLIQSVRSVGYIFTSKVVWR